METKSLIASLQWPIWFVLMALVMGYLSKARTTRKNNDDTDTMQAPFSLMMVGVVCVLFFGALTMLSIIYPGVRDGVPLDSPNYYAVAVFVGFALLGLILTASSAVEKHRLSQDILYYRMLTKRGELAWRDITYVEYLPFKKWFRLTGNTGKTVCISIALTNLQEFARILLQQVPASNIHDQTRELLSDVADGNLPALW